MTTPRELSQEQEPYLELTWNDPVSGHKGWLVIERLFRGLSSGGLRMRPGCSLEEVRRLARAMSLKEALNYDPAARYIPLGGAKGGIDFDPRDPGADGVLERYIRAVRPFVASCWATGEDLGLTQPAIDKAVAAAGLESSVQAIYPLLENPERARERLRAAFAQLSRGVPLDLLVGGYGVATAALATMEKRGMQIEKGRAFVQGFGSMGGATARYLNDAGLCVVGLSDISGVVANPDGIGVETLLASRSSLGGIDRSKLGPGDKQLPLEAWLSVEADLLVPAATSDCITEANCSSVTARVIVEAANLPVTPAAEAALSARGVEVIPDVVANSATNSWWWWALFGDIEPTVEASLLKIDAAMRALVGEMLERADAAGSTPREAVAAMAAERLTELERRFGSGW